VAVVRGGVYLDAAKPLRRYTPDHDYELLGFLR
jgi:hypothetical protein